MSKLRTRIGNQAGNQREAMAAYHPYGTGDTPMVMPMHRYTVTPDGIAVEQMHPVPHPAGYHVAAVPRGSWGHVRAAGQP